MQVRYADTPSQKELKRVTAERRQYRTNEYNIGAYGTPAVGINPTIYAPTMWNRRGGAATRYFDTTTGIVYIHMFLVIFWLLTWL